LKSSAFWWAEDHRESVNSLLKEHVVANHSQRAGREQG
jgi:hypothetical protein